MTTTRNHIDPQQFLAHLGFRTRMELGARDFKCSDDAVWFKIGMGPSTSWVEIGLDSHDLYTVEIFKLRGTKRTTLGQTTALGIYADMIGEYLTNLWCDICAEKGW